MKITDLNGKSVAILGYGKEGRATEAALKKYAPDASVTVRDQKDGAGYLDGLDTFDVIIASPGIPPSVIPETKTPVTNSTQIFLDSIDPQTVVIGVTGSKGKSTTASLIQAILKEAGKDSMLVGNIGDPAIAHIAEGGLNKFFVQELSSYQLMRLTRSPHIAVITSFFPEHLDYHGSLQAYKDAKMNCTRFQSEEDIVFHYADSDGAKDIAEQSKGTVISYADTDSPIAVQDTRLIGIHNLFNIAAAATVARHLGIDDATIVQGIREFKGLPHRLQDIGLAHGIRWVDDAISTTPESTAAALRALTPHVKTLIAGGQDRGSDFTDLGEIIASTGVQNVILMGESGPRIGESITDPQIIVHEADSMESAVNMAKDCTPEHSICLLSPASPSYGMFTNFEEKGEIFKKLLAVR